MRVLFGLILFVSFSCSTARGDLKLSKLVVNGKVRNSLIEDRVPKYGDGRKDGCVVMGQIFLTINTTNGSLIKGVVRDVKTVEPLSGAVIQVWSSRNERSFKYKTDVLGRFQLKQEFVITRLEIQSIGYRTMIIDLGQKAVL